MQRQKSIEGFLGPSTIESGTSQSALQPTNKRHSLEFEDMDDFSEQDSVSDDRSCSSASVLSAVYDSECIHGRYYHGYKLGRYPFPNDEMEQQREEIIHAIMMEIADGRLFYADAGEHPQKIIDIGTGTGTWAIDAADTHPSASVIGTDLSAIQPTWVPVNLRMFIDDCEEPDWLHGSGFDLIHYRGMAGSVRDFSQLVQKSYPHVKRGGWIEVQELVPIIRCDDESMTANDPLALFYKAYEAGMRQLGFNLHSPEELVEVLQSAGLVNVQCIQHKVPVGGWSEDPKLREIGLLNKAAISAGLGAMASKPMVALDLSLEHRKSISKYARLSLDNGRIHRYMTCYFVYGQKQVSSDGVA